jgi:mRNA deadenylase 3'-5' endonuclease subunit Ccr4
MTDNVAIIVLLKRRTTPYNKNEQFAKISLNQITKDYLCVVNTHLFWNPIYPEIKTAQCSYLLEKTKLFLRSNFGQLYEQCPIVFCGDFNSKPNSEVYSLLTQGKTSVKRVMLSKKKSMKEINDIAWKVIHSNLDYNNDDSDVSSSKNQISQDSTNDDEKEISDDEIAEVEQTVNLENFIEGYHEVAIFENDLQLSSVYAMSQHREPHFTNYTQGFNGTLDYIFIGQAKRTESGQPEHLRLRATLDTISETAAKEFVALPSFKYSSDHIALYCEVEIV